MDRKVPHLRIAFSLTAVLITLVALVVLNGCGEEPRPPDKMILDSGKFENGEGSRPHSPRILRTGYSLLNDIGGEEPGYGLYSYAIVVEHSNRSTKFLYDVLSTIDRVADLSPPHSQLNLLSIPNKNKAEGWSATPSVSVVAFAKYFYDYTMARALLDHICDPPAEGVKVVCECDLSRGPYIFSYAQPASKLAPVLPPFLFMDLSDVHERAFPEIIDAFLVQVKREDFSDRAKIDTLRLKLLSIVLTAADWISPVQKAMADILHVASGPPEKDKK